jgi:RNA polymerase sigma-70 factor (ECF subfamily)
MENNELIPHLFRTEYRKICSVLCKLFGFEHIEIAEDIASETFLLASETWGQKGLPQNPTAWLYMVAKNKAKDVLKHQAVFTQKVSKDLKRSDKHTGEIEVDLSQQNIQDSQLQMMFAICHPVISVEAQIGLSLSILCGFGAEEIADAFLTSKESIYKRLSRAKEKLREEKIKIELPSLEEVHERLGAVLTTMYLLFNEGYYSSSQSTPLRKELCLEAMRMTFLLTENEITNQASVNALLALMCFHASRFEARTDSQGETILYEDQDTSLWDKELIEKGHYYLFKSSGGTSISKYHLEAAIAYWHTHKEDTKEKWESILQLYNRLLQLEYSPIAALNRTYALSKANSKEEAIQEAKKLELKDNHFYYLLLATLEEEVPKVLDYLQTALSLAKTDSDKRNIRKKINSFEHRGDKG